MTRAHALWAAIGISVGTHAWMLAEWGQGEVRAPAPPAPGHVLGHGQGGMRLRWVSVPPPARPDMPQAEPMAPAMPAAKVADVPTPVVHGTERIAPPVPAPAAPPATHFWLPSEVDFRALPQQAPDTTALDGQPWASDQAVRLRLFIDARGQVVDVASRDASPPPAEVIQALGTMFKATPFLPARRLGKDVASRQDIEILPPCGASAPCSGP
jgi:hypothetical protein